MFKKRDYVICSVVTYIVLILLIFFLRDIKDFDYECNTNRGCVRFCCNDHHSCNEEFIKNNFNTSLVPKVWSSDEEGSKVKIILGQLTCPLELVSTDSEWKFFHVSSNKFKDTT